MLLQVMADAFENTQLISAEDAHCMQCYCYHMLCVPHSPSAFGCCAQVARQLQKANAEIAMAEAASSGHASALSENEKQKKWMKF